MALESVSTQIGAVTYQIDSDALYARHIEGVFEPSLIELFDHFDLGDGAVLDVGANIGCTALYFQQRSDNVIAFEASASTAAIARANLERAGTGDRIDLRAYGLGREASVQRLMYSENNRSGGFVNSDFASVPGHVDEAVEIRRGDAILGHSRFRAGRHVSAIKVDVEGYELAVLDGLKRTIQRSRPICFVEMNHFTLSVVQRTSLPDFIDALRATFPIAYAVHERMRFDLHDPAQTFSAMHENILNRTFAEIVCGFRDSQFARFRAEYVRPVLG